MSTEKRTENKYTEDDARAVGLDEKARFENTRTDLSTEAWMVLNMLDHEWFQALVATCLNLHEDEVVKAAKEINQLAGRDR